jgi:hypothetical protein
VSSEVKGTVYWPGLLSILPVWGLCLTNYLEMGRLSILNILSTLVVAPLVGDKNPILVALYTLYYEVGEVIYNLNPSIDFEDFLDMRFCRFFLSSAWKLSFSSTLKILSRLEETGGLICPEEVPVCPVSLLNPWAIRCRSFIILSSLGLSRW